MEKISINDTIGNIRVKLVSDVDNYEVLDTQVKIGDQALCWIAGKDRREFIKEINQVINKFKI